jgi:hypothetical protein
MTIGHNNVFIGNGVATNSSSTGNTVAIGTNAGSTNTTGINNTFIGAYTDANAGNYNNSTAIGYGTTITKSNQIKLDASDSINFQGDTNISGNLVLSNNGSNLNTYYIKPKLVGFSFFSSYSSTLTFTNGAMIPIGSGGWNIQSFNSGCVNTTTNKYFIAPIAGYYMFHFSIFAKSTNTTEKMEIKINDGSAGYAAQARCTNTYWCRLNFTDIFKLNVNDTVKAYAASSNLMMSITGGTSETCQNCFGFLLSAI